MSSRRGLATVVVAVIVIVGGIAWVRSSGDDGPPSVTAESTSTTVAPRMTILTGEAVPGTAIEVRLEGLHRVRGSSVEIRVRTASPVFVGGRDVVGQLSAGSGAVDPSGAGVMQLDVPNALSGEDDIIPLVPTGDYVLEVVPIDGSSNGTERVPFPVAAARVGTPYAVVARRGAQECGAPPLEIDVDGSMWTPDDGSAFAADTKSFEGTLTLQTATTASFHGADGTSAAFTRSATGYSCV